MFMLHPCETIKTVNNSIEPTATSLVAYQNCPRTIAMHSNAAVYWCSEEADSYDSNLFCLNASFATQRTHMQRCSTTRNSLTGCILWARGLVLSMSIMRICIRRAGMFRYRYMFRYKIMRYITGTLPNCRITGTFGMFLGFPKTVHSRCPMYHCTDTLSGTSDRKSKSRYCFV
jgi:hypothetical protein